MVDIQIEQIPSIKGYEATEPYTGCGCIHFYYNRKSNTSASECEGNIEYGDGMTQLPKWQHPILEIAMKYCTSWNSVYTLLLAVECMYNTPVANDQKTTAQLLELVEEMLSK